MLGLTLTSPEGVNWRIAPVLSGLSAAEGGLETTKGWFGVKWQVNNDELTLTLETPAGTTGTVVLPGQGVVTVDGKKSTSGGTVDVSGGSHTLTRKV